MKLVIVLILSALALTGCDDNKAENQAQKTVQQGSVEEFKFDCVTSKTIECTVVAGDLLGSGKWHHAKVYIYPDNIDANIDGEHFSKEDFDSSLFEGQKISTYTLVSAEGKKASLTVTEKGASVNLNLEAWNSEGKRFLTASR